MPADVLKSLDAMVAVRVVLIVAGAWLLAGAVRRLLPWMAAHAPDRYRLNLLSSVPVLRLVIVVAAIALLVRQVIEPTVQNLVAILGALGLALGFAFKDYASSLIAGIVTLYERPYRVGDWIEVGGIYGEVEHIGLRALRLHTIDDNLVTIPHLKLWNAPVSNATAGALDLQVCARFHLDPAHDAARARELLRDVALTSPYLQLEKPVRVVVKEEPWGTVYSVRAYPVDGRDQAAFASDVTVRGKAILQREGFRTVAVGSLARMDGEGA